MSAQGSKDKWGHPFFYPTAQDAGVSGSGSGFFYQQSADVLDDDHFQDTNADVSNSGNGQFTIDFGSSDSVVVLKHKEFINSKSIGGCDMDFAATKKRKYAYKPDDPRDVELKMVIRVQDAASGTGLSLKGPSGHHDSPTPCCQGQGYMFSMEGLSNSPQKFRFRKEMYHVNYDDHPGTGTWTHPKVNFALEGAGWRGICFVRYNKKDGVSPGNDSVVVEGWFNPTPETNKNNWIMLKRVEDRGGWGDGGTSCNGVKDQILTWSNGMFIIKASDITMDVKQLSLREIDPSIGFDDTPDTPTPTEQPGETQTIQGKFKLQWDINTQRVSQCAGTGVEKFYDITVIDSDRGLTSHADYGGRIRIGQKCTSSTNSWFNKRLKLLDVQLMKLGTPASTPTVSAKIWNAAGSVVDTATTTVDPSTLSDSVWTTCQFDFGTNLRQIVVGDVVGVEYLGSSNVNLVLAPVREANIAGGVRAYYNSTGWHTESTTDFPCTMYE